MAAHDLCRVDQLVEGRGRPARAGGRYLAVFLVGGDIHVLDNQCLHLESPIDGGPVIDGGIVVCPWHGWSYELATGDLCVGDLRRPGLRHYDHEVVNGLVRVTLED